MLFYRSKSPGSSMMDKLLVWLQERIKLWTKPVTSSFSGRHTFRLNAQSCRSSCRKCVVASTTYHSKTASQAPSANQRWSYSAHSSCPLYEILETSPSYSSAWHPPTLASESVLHVLAAEVARQAKGCIRNDRFDPKAGKRKPVVGSRTDTRWIVEGRDWGK